MNNNLSDSVLVKQVIASQSIASGATVDGTGVDCAGYERLTVAIEVGLASTGNVTVKLQESSDNTGSDPYADIALATTAALDSTTDNEQYLIDVNLSEREQYIRAVATVAGGGTVVCGVVFLLAGGRHLPPTQDNTVVRIGYA
jgi:hypothetical protein